MMSCTHQEPQRLKLHSVASLPGGTVQSRAEVRSQRAGIFQAVLKAVSVFSAVTSEPVVLMNKHEARPAAATSPALLDASKATLYSLQIYQVANLHVSSISSGHADPWRATSC